MQYQPLVTHYCKKFHEAALGGREISRGTLQGVFRVLYELKLLRETNGSVKSRASGQSYKLLVRVAEGRRC